jgi:cellulose biosynthesis protein BcsQ
MKQAIITPLLKKAHLDAEVLKNYRPVSNLSFISKVIERVVADRLANHIATNGLAEPLQSAYRKNHSTETALLKVTNDILRAIDSGKCVLLVLLDLSAAFDTVDHQTLLSRLTQRFGITGTALSWFQSYLSDRKQSVVINGMSSQFQNLEFGVPQGSVLGPQLFTAYTTPLGSIMRDHNTDFHLYADDSQLHLSFEPVCISTASATVVECISSVRHWMAQNFLKLNDDKTEFLVIGTPHQLTKIPSPSLTIGDAVVSSTQTAKNIGVVFDQNMNFAKHVDTICHAGRYHLRNIGKIRKYLDASSTELVVHAFISTKLDYMNSLLYGLPATQLQKLQRLQNTAARVISRTGKFEHITPVLYRLHWLPVKQRINFKILMLTFRALHGQAPGYLSEMLQVYEPTRSLRSQNELRLVQPMAKLKTFGDRSFSCAAPFLWNRLPTTVRESPSLPVFKKN